MKLSITLQAQFDDAVAKGLFKLATSIFIAHLPLLTALPELPAATDVSAIQCPLVEQKAQAKGW